jgi:hypothetical protein
MLVNALKKHLEIPRSALFLSVGEKIRTPDLLVRRRRYGLFFDVVFEEILDLQAFLILDFIPFS